MIELLIRATYVVEALGVAGIVAGFVLLVRSAGPVRRLDPEHWSFDVTIALHDDMKGGGDYPTVRSRVVVSRTEFPRWTTAAEVAGCMAAGHHGGMPIEILPRY